MKTADEMYFLESFRGQRHLPGAAHKRGGTISIVINSCIAFLP